jgi:hypothetical protein
MSIVRPITRPVTRPSTGYVVGGDFDPGLIARRSEAIFDDSDLTSMFVGRDGSGGNPSPGETVGLQLDKSHMGGMTAAAYIDSRPELSDPDNQLASSATASRNGDGFDITSTGASVQIYTPSNSITPGDFYQLTFTWSGNTTGRSIRGWINGVQSEPQTTEAGSHTILMAAGNDALKRVIVYIAGDTTGETFYLEITSIKHIPGQHRQAAADNERPVLDLTNGVYSLDYDGVDDGLSFDFSGGAGPADCSVFYAENTGSGWMLVEDESQDYSGVSSLSMADIVGATPNGKYIGPIIVETSKLTNSLRRSIETYLKRKAGIL